MRSLFICLRRGLLLAAVLLLAALFVACVTPGPTPPPAGDTYTVVLTVPSGVSINGDNAVTVEEGADAVFTLTLPEKTVFKSATAGVFDAMTGTLTIKGVTANMRVNLEIEEVEYDTNATVRFLFGGGDKDTASVPANSSVKFGSQITVTAGDDDRIFVGWVLDSDKNKVISTSKEYTFRVTPDISINGVAGYRLGISPKYIDLGTFFYDANGGQINGTAECVKGNAYQTVSVLGDGRLRVNLSKSYLSYITCATAFWNDGTFTRDGYILKEFNTAPDGSGEPYSPGSKFYPLREDGTSFTLYCIWEAFDASQFTYEPITMDYPSAIGDDRSKATHWRTEGVKITGYTGDSATVAIPDELGGKPVIAIGRGAIKNKSVSTLVLPRHIQRIEDGAVVGCSSLSTIYYPNSVYEASDAILDAASYENFKTFILTSTMAPRYAADTYGDFSNKLARVLSTMDQNRIILISGSSSYQGLSTPYLEALFDGEYAVINFGTTRTAHCALYLEAIKHYTHEGDIVIYSPENSTFLMGDNVLYWKTFRDLEGMNNIYRYVDISNYDKIFSSLSGYNQGIPYDEQKVTAYYAKPAQSFEMICERAGVMNKYGDDVSKAKEQYLVEKNYIDAYTVTLNAFYRNHNEGTWSQAGSQNDYRDATYWSNILEEPYLSMMRHCVSEAKKGGAQVYFGFAPIDSYAMLDEIDAAWLAEYDTAIAQAYGFDGAVGTTADFIYDHRYFYDCAFHTNNYGRTWHTYNLYVHISALLDRDVKHTAGELGTSFEGCLFEVDARGQALTSPKYPWSLK